MLELIEKAQYEAINARAIFLSSIILICWLFMAIACFIDLWSGVSAAKHIGDPLHSRKFRETFTKIGDYWRVLIFGLMFDALGCLFAFYKLPFASIILASAAIAIEMFSVIENSKKKKAHAGDVLSVATEIVECVNEKDAKKIIETIVNKL